MKKLKRLFNKSKSVFVRSVITRVLAIFITVSVIITAEGFFSFTTEIKRSNLAERQKQLTIVEDTISDRMEEVTSIAYNIGKDPAFYLEPLETDRKTGREISEILKRYLIGNGFIEHLAFCRTSEPDTIYTAGGVRSLSAFFISDIGMDPNAVPQLIENIHKDSTIRVVLSEGGEKKYFNYGYPLPQLSSEPKAHVLMMIPLDEVKPLFESLLIDGHGKCAVFDADGREIYVTGALEDDIDLTAFVSGSETEETYKADSGKKYVLQKVVSESNGWTYVSAIYNKDTLSGLANKQVAVIAFIFVMLVISIVIMLASIIAQFKPISKLAEQVADKPADGGRIEVVDERKLLADKIATLQGDSEQKQKYEAAFYEAEAASKAKSAFLSSMSHDIRTPMNAIIGMTAIARKHIDEKEYVDECLKKVQASSDYLLDIINNVLDMSRIESGRIPIAKETVYIPALIDSVVSLMTSGAEAKSQTITVDIGELSRRAVVGDSTHLIQVFVNIISNAVKFTPEGGGITIKVRQTESDEHSGNYVFSFSDTGIGIPPEFIGKVFDTFTRAGGAVASKTEGTGLGMAIAKKLVELMGGTIACESETGKGTTFTVTMRMEYTDQAVQEPIAKSKEAESEDNGAEGIVDLTGKRLLLVEDNEMNREIAGLIISETNIELVEATDGKQALDLFMEHPVGYFDIIMMDIQMPVMNGYEATAAIRHSDRADGATIPIFAMTANTFDEDVRQVKDAGMNGHIGKPYNPETLYKVLAQTLANGRANNKS